MASSGLDDALPPGTMRRGFKVQIRVVGALMLRELHTRYGRENIGYIWLFLEPMMLATMIGLIHAKSGGHAGGLKPVPMGLVGYCNFMTFRTIFGRAEGALEGSLSLLHHRTISIVDVLVARALLEWAATSMAFFILIGLAIATGLSDMPARPLIVLLGMILMPVTHDNAALGRLTHPLCYIMMPLSGMFFAMGSLPENIRQYFLIIPLAHVFEILRYGWFKDAHWEYIDPLYLAEWIGISTLLGLLLLSLVRQRIHMP